MKRLPTPRLPGWTMAALLALGSTAPAAAQDIANPLDAERWKTRPVVVVVPQESDPLLTNLRTTLQQTAAREAFREREMVLYTVVAGSGRRNGEALSAAQTSAMLAALGLHPDGSTAFVLVGKDGGVKLREGASVNLQAVFDEIDRMPMRQAR